MSVNYALYMNNPTVGGVDGTRISTGDNSLPLTATLDASQNEAVALKCAVRCDSGYKIASDCTISFTGTNSSKWKVANDNNYADANTALQYAVWDDSITISDIGTTNKIFWAKAMSSSDENPSNDTSVKLQAIALVSLG